MIARIVEAVDQIPEMVLLGINLCMAGFILFAHGGYLAMMLVTGGEIPIVITISVPLSLIFIITCVVGFTLKNIRPKILTAQAFGLMLGFVFTFYYGVSLLIEGLPDGNFSWGPGLFTFFCVYPVYLARRFIFRGFISKSAVVKYAHVVVLVVALSVDTAVMVKVVAHFGDIYREIIENHRVK